MRKYKIRYYEHIDIIEKEIEARGFTTKENKNGASVIFHSSNSGADSNIFAFSNFISIEKIDY